MKRARYFAAVGTLILAVAISSGTLAASKPQEVPIEVRKTEERAVLYTLHRGPLEKVGSTIQEIMATVLQKGINPNGPISFLYLNNFEGLASEHWLTEIRIPVGREALSLAGTLGRFTDVKTLPSVEVAVAGKPEGHGSPASIYERLYTWIFENSYLPIEGPAEKFLTNAETQDYAQMKTEIMVPVRKMSKTR